MEERVPGGVERRGDVVGVGLRGLALDDASVGLADHQLAALDVGGGLAAQLGGIGGAGGGEPAGDGRVGRGAEVVGVGDAHVAEAGVEEGDDDAGGVQGRVEVAVAGRAPLEVWVLLPGDGGEVRGQELGLAVLQEVDGQAVDREVGVAPQGGQRVLAGAEGVHEQQREAGAGGLPGGADLADDDVQEGEDLAAAGGLADGQERLGLVHAHGRAEPAVELEHRGLREGGCRVVVADGQLGAVGDVDEGVDVGLADQAGLAGLQEVVEPRERVDRGGYDACLGHLGAGLLEPGGVGHGPQAIRNGWGRRHLLGRPVDNRRTSRRPSSARCRRRRRPPRRRARGRAPP